MLVCNPYEVVIHGTTSKGKIFRPSDWAERLCGILSSFDKDNPPFLFELGAADSGGQSALRGGG